MIAYKFLRAQRVGPFSGFRWPEPSYRSFELSQRLNDSAEGDYGDKLTFLETPENFTRRIQLWNEVKAAQ